MLAVSNVRQDDEILRYTCCTVGLEDEMPTREKKESGASFAESIG